MDQPFDVLINLSFRENHKALEYIMRCFKSLFSYRSMVFGKGTIRMIFALMRDNQLH